MSDDQGTPRVDGPPPVDEDLLPENQPASKTVMPPSGIGWTLVLAIVWAVVAAIVGLVFIFGVNAETYGGDAYTGIDKAIVLGVHAIGWMIISSGVLGLVIAGSRTGRPR